MKKSIQSSPFAIEINSTALLSPTTPSDLNDNQNLWKKDFGMTLIYSIALFRSVYVILGEADLYSFSSINHYTSVFVPLFISIVHVMLDDLSTLSNRIVEFIKTTTQAVVFFGLAWSLPSTFNTQNNTMPSFILFLCVARILKSALGFCKLTRHNIIGTKLIVTSAISCLCPVIVWIVCFLQRSKDHVYFYYVIGVAVDAGVFCLNQFNTVMMKGGTIGETIYIIASINKVVQTVILISTIHLFEYNPISRVSEAYSTLSFNYLNIIIGILILLLPYHIANFTKFRPIPTNLHLKTGKVLLGCLQLFSLGICGGYLSLIASMNIAMIKLLEPLDLSPKFPVNLNLNRNLTLDFLPDPKVDGNSYLMALTGVTHITNSELNYNYIPGLFASLGVYSISLVGLDFAYRFANVNSRNNYLSIYMAIIAVVSILISVFPINWPEIGPIGVLIGVPTQFILLVAIQQIFLNK